MQLELEPPSARLERVRFKHPVRVVPINGPPRAWRLLSANLSPQGMFLRMPNPLGYPLEPGTRVALSLEAGGRVFPFAQAEVVWRRTQESLQPDADTGFGVRFTGFLHPRASDLVGYLVSTLDRGVPLKAAEPRKRRWPLVAALAATGALAAVAALGLLWFGFSADDDPAELAEATAPATPHEPEPTATAPVAPKPAAAQPEPAAERAEPAPIAAQPAAAPVPVPAQAEPKVPVVLAAIDLSAPAVKAQPAAPVVEDLAPVPAHKPSAQKLGADAPDDGPGAVASRPANSLSLPSGAAKALRWESARDELRIMPELSGEAAISRTFMLADPPRLVFDVGGGAPLQSATLDAKAPHIRRVRIGKQGASTRIVVDLDRAPGDFVEESGSAILSF